MRYFMHYCDGLGFIEDEQGRELADDGEARREAIAGARDIMAADMRDGRLDMSAHIEVEDEAHRLRFTIGFADAVTVTSDPQTRPWPRDGDRLRCSPADD